MFIAFITNYYKLGGLKEQKGFLLQFWRGDVLGHGVKQTHLRDTEQDIELPKL